jgi:acetyl/propionyl-CoA carboxylase alpha subunit
MEIPIHYDPMIAKLVVWGTDRNDAIARCRRALQDYHLVGVPTSIPFFLALFDDPVFRSGVYDTGFITPTWLADALAKGAAPQLDDVLAAAAIARFEADRAHRPAEAAGGGSDWKRMGAWKSRKGIWR